MSMSERPEPIGPPPPRAGRGALLFWILAGLVVAGLYFGRGYFFDPPARPGQGTLHPAVGQSPKVWRLEPLTGDPPPINRDALNGKVTLVNYWGTWCPPCQAEFPHIVALWQKLKDDPEFQLAAVSCEPSVEKDIERLRATTQTFVDHAKTTMPTYYDPSGQSRYATMAMTGELAFPATILFDRTGTVRAFWLGYTPGMERDVEAAVRAVLKDEAAAEPPTEKP